MDNTEKARELINKHLSLHGGDELGINDGDVYRAVLDAVSEALTIPVVVGRRSEQLFKLRDNCVNGVDDEVCRNSGICKYCP